jgi:putative tryptophan/tyrosine transport system substrate-binding protein
MRRREFIGVLGGAAAWPVLARAQPSSVPRVGYVWIGARGTDDLNQAGLRQGFVDKGYVIGRNLALEERYADGNVPQVPVLIAELLALNVDVLVTPGLLVARAAKRATSTVPIVCVAGDPVGAGLVTSLSRPGGNVTGLSLLSIDYSAKWLELLKEAVSNLDRVAVLWNPDNPANAEELEHMRETARVLGLDLTSFPARPTDVEATFPTIANANFGGLVVATDASLESLSARIVEFSAQHHLPAIYPFSTTVQRGGLMSYSADFFAIWRRMASYVDRILKGARPADLPIEQATEVVLKLNLKTAKALGIEIPPQLIARADEVIE